MECMTNYLVDYFVTSLTRCLSLEDQFFIANRTAFLNRVFVLKRGWSGVYDILLPTERKVYEILHV